MGTIWKVLTRKKVIDPVTAEDTQLARRLNTFDLTALGVGSTLGVGVYVLAGHVAKSVAGPSVVLSFLIAAVASVFAGLCYAEFGARAPRAGSAYIYSYVCVGEFVAFIIGWNLILEYIIGSASVAKGLSLYLDTLINNTLQNTFTEIAPINIPFMAKYFDFFSCGISILLAVALAFGLKESSLANNIFTTLNIGVVIFVIIAGSLKADPANWHYQPDNSTNATVVGTGGFFPFGIEGTITGAATCFYGFVGFDCIATTGEEAKNPKKAIPLSIILSLLIIFLAYFGISTVVTLMVPYYLQNPDAPIPYAFEHIGWNWAKWVVSIGGIFGLCASLFGAMFPLPRVIYAMANDSLVFKFLGRVSSRFQTPVVGTLIAGTLTGLMAAMFELNQLVNMMSIGTLMAYTIVAASVLLLRFSMDDHRISYIPVRNNSDSEDESYTDQISTFDVQSESPNEDYELLSYESRGPSIIGQIFNCGRHAEPTKTSQSIVAVEVFLYCITCVLIGLSALYLKHPLASGAIWAIVLVSCIVFVAAILVMSIATQPVSTKELTFKVPMVPLIPALSILANIYLMLMLDYHTWIRFAVWMAIGLPTYIFSIRSIDEQPAQIARTHTPTKIHEKSNGKLNSYTNNGFVEDLNNIDIKKKKIPPPPPPRLESENKTSEVIEIQQELEKLDEMLDQEANNLDKNRKASSVGSMSVSDVTLREENVIADVHCDNVLTTAIPNNPTDYPPFVSSSLTENIEHSEVQTAAIINEFINIENSNVDTEEVIKEPDVNPLTDINLDTHMAYIESPDDVVIGQTKLYQRPLSFISHSGLEQRPAEATPYDLSPTPTPPPSANSSPILAFKLGDNVLNNTAPPTLEIEETASKISTPPPPPPLPNQFVLQFSIGSDNLSPSSSATGSPVPTPKHDKDFSSPPPPPLPVSESESPVITPKKEKSTRDALPRVTSNNIKQVTLRHIKKKPKETNKELFTPEDDNLKIRSEKAKSFLEKLNSELVKGNKRPASYIVPIKKGPAPPPSPQKKEINENVIEESIDRNAAKEKFGLLVDIYKRANSEDTKDSEVDKNVSASVEVNKNVSASVEVNNSPEKVKDNNASEQTEDSEESAYLAHKNRMQNVFRSMKNEGHKEPESTSRNIKSLDHRSDEAKHRQAMTNIFDDIELRRKKSTEQQ